MVEDLSKYPSAGVIWAEATRRVASQVDQVKHIETKANILTAFAGFVVPTLLSSNPAISLMLFFQLLAIVMTFYCAYEALKPRKYAVAVDLEWVIDELLEVDAEETQFTLSHAAVSHLKTNEGVINDKADWFNLELTMFLISVGLIIAGRLPGVP